MGEHGKNNDKNHLGYVTKNVYFCDVFYIMNMRYLIVLLLSLVISCQKGNEKMETLNHIKTVGDSNAIEAIRLLDSLKPEVSGYKQYEKMKYLLLTVRVNDKAERLHRSDSIIKEVLSYFLNNGNDKEKQEVLYYAGSVYRDLHDYPRALKYFLKSKDACSGEYDTLMLRNTYSNLSFVYHETQDYSNSLLMAKEDYKISQTLGILDPASINQVGIAQLKLSGDKKTAGRLFGESYSLLKEQWKTMSYDDRQYYAYLLLYYLSVTKQILLANDCYLMVDKYFKDEPMDANKALSVATYYMKTGKITKAISLLKENCSASNNIEERYDCLKILTKLLYTVKDVEGTAYYANKFMQISDTLDLGKRQEMLADANNRFKYYKDKDAEIQLIKDATQGRINNILLISFSFFVILLLTIVHYRKKNLLLKRLVSLENIQAKMAVSIQEKEAERSSLEVEILGLNQQIGSLIEAKESVNTEMLKIKKELEESRSLLKEKKDILAKFMQEYFHSESKIEDDDFNRILQKNADYGGKMTEEQWKRLFTIVDKEDSTFMGTVMSHLKQYDTEKFRYCYLMRYGMKSAQIMRIMDAKSSTHYRRMEELEWVWSSKRIDSKKG